MDFLGITICDKIKISTKFSCLFFYKVRFLYNVEQHADEVEQAAENHEEVEDAVHIAALFAEAVKHRANCIGNAAGEKVDESRQGDSGDGNGCGNQHTPTHTDIANHRKYRVFFQVDGSEGGGGDAETPDNPENEPTPNG